MTAVTCSNRAVDDLAIGVFDRRDGRSVRVDFEGNSALYSRSQLANHQARFMRLLEAMVAKPVCAIGHVEFVGAAERTPHLAVLNQSDRDGPDATPSNAIRDFQDDHSAPSIPGRFEARVAQFPGRDAVVTGRHRWTYEMLHADAERIARAVVSAGPGSAEPFVGLLFEPGAPMVAAMLGTMKAGRAYVPLDPSAPTDRLSKLLMDAGVKLVLADSETMATAQGLQDSASLELLDIDRAPRANELGCATQR